MIKLFRDLRPSSSTKQRLIDAAKMLLDIAKESADALPPLKSCLGGINAIVKHYEDNQSVKENLEDLVSWVGQLKKSLTEASGGPEDAKRREQLRQSLGHIENQSRELLSLRKGRRDRFFDKTRDAQTVVTLVRDIGRALLIYKASQQQSMHNIIAELSNSFDEFVKTHEPRSQKVKKKVASTLEQLHRLLQEPNPGDTGVDGKELKRRTKLSASLMEVQSALRSLSGRFTDVKYTATEEDREVVYDLAEDIRDAISEYQFSQQKDIYEQGCVSIALTERCFLLNSIKPAEGAGYEHRDRHGCLKGTRVALLDEIERWAEDLDGPPIFWLNGLAGTGKSTIAHTVAERCVAKGILGASFFCSANVAPGEGHDNPGIIFPTLAYQLSQKYPKVRSALLTYLESDHEIVCKSFETQAEKLIIGPLRSAGVKTVIVIDAFDECKGEQSSSAILSALESIAEQVPEAKLFITSRPRPLIECDFHRPECVAKIFTLHDTTSYLIDNNDIRAYLKHELSGVAARKLSDNHMTAPQLDLLSDRAAGLFVYATATVKFLGSGNKALSKQYTLITNSPDTIHEGKAKGAHRGLSLDSLCTSILIASFENNDNEDNANVRSVLAAVALSTLPPPLSGIPGTVSLEMGQVLVILRPISSLLELHKDNDHPVRPFHKLLFDCLKNPDRCTDERFLINIP